MEPKNHKIARGFLDPTSQREIIEYVDSINESVILTDHHLKHLVSKINGNSYMYDISRTELTQKITKYQSGGTVIDRTLPEIFNQLIEKITDFAQIPKNHLFLQIVDMDRGGKIERHYDTAIQGFINYKCNISVLSEKYDFCIDGETLEISEGDLYCFEASLYKHWTPNPFNSRRVLLSFGFIVPYSDLGRDPEDPRIRLSNRIEKYFQK